MTFEDEFFLQETEIEFEIKNSKYSIENYNCQDSSIDNRSLLSDYEIESLVPFENNSILSFNGHTGDPIYSLMSINGLILSGGGDDHCRLWSLENAEELFPDIFSAVTFSDSVALISISFDKVYCAVGALSGQIRIWKITPQYVLILTIDGPYDLSSLQFHPKGQVLLASGSDGTIWLWSIPSGNCLTVLATDSFSIIKAAFFQNTGKHIVSSSEDGTIKIWDPRSPSPIFKYHSSSPINSFDLYDSTSNSSRYIVCGNEEGKISLLQGDNGILLREVHDIHSDSIETISFAERNEKLYVLSGCLGGKLAILEAPSLALRTICTHPTEITAIKAISYNTFFIAVTGSTDGNIRVWDILTGTLTHTLYGHIDTILDFCYLEERCFGHYLFLGNN